ncbi:MAG: hemolysin III family protein [Bacteroidia bacterium]
MTYSPKEELANSITHGLGVLLLLVAVPLLVSWTVLHGSLPQVWGVGIFGFSMLLLYSASTLYHSISEPNLKKTFRLIDHISIFFLIGGSYTPFMLTFLNNQTGYIVLSTVWGLAVIGILYKLFYMGKSKWFGIALYLLMGWLVVFVGDEIVGQMSAAALSWLIAGGLSYTIGVFFYRKKRCLFTTPSGTSLYWEAPSAIV